MAYTDAEARQQLLDGVAEATDKLALALAALGAAYEQLDEYTADTLEEQLFRPVQGAYGRAKRTHAGFAERSGLPARAFVPPDDATVSPSRGVAALIEAAVEAGGEADALLASLQDSMLPVEVGDPELRAGLSAVREQVADLRARARTLVRGRGR
jgi:hypothetical protein